MKHFLLSFFAFSLGITNIFSQNLIINGDFSNGNVSFSSSYQYAATTNVANTQSHYGITNNPNSWDGTYTTCGDHTTGTGKMLVVDGSTLNSGNDEIWSQTVTVVPGRNYSFTYWIQSLSAANLASIETSINGVLVAAPSTSPATIVCGNWLKVTNTWFSGASTSARIALNDRIVTAAGNDFAIDDVAFFVTPPTATIAGSDSVCLYNVGSFVVFTGAGGVAPYTFTYNINGGTNLTVTTTSGDNVAVPVSTAFPTTLNYNLVSVSYGSAPVVSQSQSGTATVIVNPLPTATISGSGVVCSGASGTVNFNGTPNATVTYNVGGGPDQTITLNGTGNASIISPVLTASSTYNLVSVDSNGTPNCSQPLVGATTLIVPTATIFGSNTISPGDSSNITFFGSPPGATVNFTSSLGPASIVLNAQGIGYYNVPYLVATTVFSLVNVVSGSCTSTVSGSATITVNSICSIPTLPLAKVTIDAPQPVCNVGECTDLLAHYYQIASSGDYNVCSIPYAPSFPFTGGTVINATGDDTWSPQVTLPFSFNFYGVCYNNVLVGTNGVITFDLVNQVPLGYCNWPYTATIPGGGFPIRNAIYGVYQDTNIASPPVTNVAVQNVNYYVLDTGVNAAPNRVFVANFNELPQFACNGSVGFQTSQIVIHETTNIIDILVNKRTSCTTWNSGSGLIGIQNQAGTLAKVPPGRNTGTWSATNEAWRFIPKSVPLVPTEIRWEMNGGPIAGSVNQNPLTVCPVGPVTYTAIVKYSNCGNVEVRKDILVDVAPPLPVQSPQNITICSSAPPPYIVDINQNAYILSGVPLADQGNYSIKYYEDIDDAKNDTPNNINFISDAALSTFTFNTPPPKTIYVRLEDLVVTGCYNVRSFTINIGAPSGTINYPSNPYCNNITTAQSVTNNLLTAGGTYSASPTGLTIDPVTGAITPSTSTVGTYTVTYTIAASGACPLFTTTASVVIQPCTCSVVASSTSQTVCVGTPITAVTYTTTAGATAASITSGTLPAGVTGNLSGGVYTLSGSPSVPGVYTYTVSITSGVDVCTATGTITVNPNTTITLTSAASTAAQTVCITTAITPIVYTIANGGTGATVTGLPGSVTGSYAGGVFTISGSPSATGTFNYTVTTTGGCSSASLSGTITVNPNVTMVLTSAVPTTSQTLCINTAITPIKYTTGSGATGVTVTGLPTNVTGSYAGGVFTISGSPNVSGTFNYTVTTTGGCSSVSLTGSITVNPNATITLTSAPTTTAQTVCINTAITPIVYTIANGGTGATVSGLPTNVTGSYAGGVFTISGSPSATGTFNYTVTTTGGCSSASLSGTITVNPNVTMVLTSAVPTTSQTLCINTAITPIKYTTGSGATGVTVTGLPTNVTGSYAGGVFTISGSPSVSGTFNYTVTTTGGCSSVSLTGSITVNPNATITLTSAPSTTAQTVCITTAITPIVYTIANGGTGATVSGLPTNVTGSYAGGVFTISGSPSATGTFNYTVTTTGGCSTASLSGTITVNPNVTMVLTSTVPTTNQTLCINTAITPIVYTTANGATGVTVTGLPTNVTGTYAGGVFTISGSPSVSGTFNYTVTTTGGCSSVSLTGSITVNPNATISLTSAPTTTAQTLCINTAITSIQYTIATGGTGATVTGLPANVTGSYAGGVFTISGSPNVSGTFNYTVTTTGGCSTASLSGTITVNPNVTLTLSSPIATTNQTVCINTPITSITYAIGNAGVTGATVSGLPANVTASYLSGVLTISGSPSVSGAFNYTVTTAGGCSSATLAGLINVSPLTSMTLTSAPTTTAQTLCTGTAITPIVYSVGNNGTGASVTGLPPGVTGNYLLDIFTISGIASGSGTYTYTVTTSGGCGVVTATGTITVNPNATITLTSAPSTTAQTVCITTAITPIVYTIANGGTGATVSGLPTNVTGSYAGGVFTISGSPSATGTFNYTVTTTGGCSSASLSGTITVNPNVTMVLTSAVPTTSQTLCINTAITPIKYTTGSGATGVTVTGLPTNVTGSYAGGVFTISGSPSVSGTFNYTVTTTGGCSSVSLTGSITVNPNATITLTSAPSTTAQTVCITTAITPIVYTIANGGTGATVSGLPTNVTGSYAGGVFTISGSPSATGTFNYTVTTTGGCSTASLSGTITVNPNVTMVLTSAVPTTSQTLCINTAITPIVYTTANGATGVTVTGLPTNVTGTYAGGVFTISGSPNVSGTFNYTVTTTGGCSSVSLTGSITVNPNATISLTSAPTTTAQTLCINTAITSIQYTIATGGTGATVTGLPANVTGSYAGGVFTISGSPNVSGTFNYTVTTTGGCSTASLSGTITVNPNVTLTLSSPIATTNQTVCINTPITSITYAIGNAGVTGATVSGLPANVTASYLSGVLTISGSPSVSGAFNYTVTTAGGCSSATLNGTITVNPNATITLTSAVPTTSQTVCINTAITPIKYTIASGGTGATVTGLPTGLSSNYTGGVFTISGTPNQPGVFNYTVSTAGGCAIATLSGTITVNPNATITLTSNPATTTQTLCVNTAMTTISYSLANVGLTGATVTGLPVNVTGSYAAGVFTISGTPTAVGTFNYTVNTAGGCSSASLNGTIVVNPSATIVRTSAAATLNQTLCINSAIVPIRFTIGNGATSASITSGGLPVGINGTLAGNVFTISGTALSSGTFNFVVSTAGGCGTASLSGVINVNPNVTLLLSSTPVTTLQTTCLNTAITPIVYTVGNGGTGAVVTGLPTGINGSYAGGIFTITGMTNLVGTYNYTVTTLGGCSTASLNGSITIDPNTTIVLSSALATANQSLCINEPITSITYLVGNGATGATLVSGALPTGVTGTYNAGTKTFTIDGVASSAGTFNYTVATVGGCNTASLSGVIRVNALPVVGLPQNGFICVDEFGVPTTTYTLSTGLSSALYTFVWSDSTGVISGAAGSNYTAIAPGAYTVQVTNALTGCVNSASATITPSLPPSAVYATASSYFADDQIVTVTVTPPGDYEYQLDNGAFQEGNQFSDLSSGTHTITVKDKYGCGSKTTTIRIIDYPKFFTPNDDGYNDTWNIFDLNTPDQPNTIITIFDRYGKLIKQISPQGTGWDGTYNGKSLPSTDYWFKVIYQEYGAPKEFKAHFSLKR